MSHYLADDPHEFFSSHQLLIEKKTNFIDQVENNLTGFKKHIKTLRNYVKKIETFNDIEKEQIVKEIQTILQIIQVIIHNIPKDLKNKRELKNWKNRMLSKLEELMKDFRDTFNQIVEKEEEFHNSHTQEEFFKEENLLFKSILKRQEEINNMDITIKLINEINEMNDDKSTVDGYLSKLAKTPQINELENLHLVPRRRGPLGIPCWIWIVFTIATILIIGFTIFSWLKSLKDLKF